MAGLHGGWGARPEAPALPAATCPVLSRPGPGFCHLGRCEDRVCVLETVGTAPAPPPGLSGIPSLPSTAPRKRQLSALPWPIQTGQTS